MLSRGDTDMLLTPDSRRRVTLPPEFHPGEPLSLESLEDGTWQLVPVVAVPVHQLWAIRPEVRHAIQDALEETGIPLDSPAGKDFAKKLGK
jgi:hypothetical protein